jgi:chemotaxis protein MotB
MQGGILSQAKKVSKEPTSQTSKDDEQTLFSVAQTLQKQFSTKPEFSRYKDQIKIDVTDEGLRIQLIDKADRVSFANGSADLTADAQAILAEVSKGICSLPNKINIGGHTDSRVFPGDNGYTNWELSADRANAARRILESNCVSSAQIHRIVGFADTEPMVPDDPYSPANRHISITVLRLTSTDNNPGESTPDGKPADPENRDSKNPSDAGKQKTPETRLVDKKLQDNGSVVVGEPDKVPDKPRVK